MKPAAASLTLSFLLFAFMITKLPLVSTDEVALVMDINGNPVYQGGQYYILPAIRGPKGGGGVRLGKTGESKCPVTVLQDYKEVGNGLPVKFSDPWISRASIDTGTSLEIEFIDTNSTTDLCVEYSSKWLVFVDNEIQKACVGIGGPENYPGRVMRGRFIIHGYKRFYKKYKLVFCESGTTRPCLDIGRYDNNGGGEGGRRLSLNEHEHDEPFGLVFAPAHHDDHS